MALCDMKRFFNSKKTCNNAWSKNKKNFKRGGRGGFCKDAIISGGQSVAFLKGFSYEGSAEGLTNKTRLNESREHKTR